MPSKNSFGQWLKQRRRLLDITQEDLARRVGCAVITLKKIEADERRPSRQIAELLAEHLDIPASERAAFVNFARTELTDSPAPWGTRFRPPTNLPPQLTPLIGRDEDVINVRKRLMQAETRLLTLVGPPGIGKTRLSLQVADRTLNDFTDGVFFIRLAAITDADLVPATIASTLGVPDVGPRSSLERLKNFLRDKELLLVLDNFEQILVAAPQIAELLATCLSIKILVTSRAPLRIRPERQFPVPALTLPDLAHLPAVATINEYSAVRLFMERAQAVNPDFSITSENAPAVVAICTRLDGLPLAIELISARVKLLPPSALLERLHGRLMLQSDGLRDIEPRHRTLNAAIDWSYQFLNADEQILFRRLGVFVGGWTLEAAEAVCAGDVGVTDGAHGDRREPLRGLVPLQINILDGIASLLDKNLVKRDSESRFMMLETIREYALDRLTSSGDLDDMSRRHALYFLDFSQKVRLHYDRPEQQWFQLEMELDNFRAALAWSRTEISSEIELRLALALASFWGRRGHLNEGISWLTDAVSQSKGLSSAAHRRLRGQALDELGVYNVWQGDFDLAEIHIEESVAISRELGNIEIIAEALGDYGMVIVLRGDLERAVPVLNEGLELYRQIGNLSGISQLQFFLGNVAYIQDNRQQAKALWQESLAGKRTAGDKWMVTNILANLAMVTLDEGDYKNAEAQLIESLILLRALSERWQVIHTLEVFARLVAEREQPDLAGAARLFGAAEAFRETFNATMMLFQRPSHEQGLATLRAKLDAETLKSAWAEGRAMTLEQAIACALEA